MKGLINIDLRGFSVKTVYLLAISMALVAVLAACSPGGGQPQQGGMMGPGGMPGGWSGYNPNMEQITFYLDSLAQKSMI